MQHSNWSKQEKKLIFVYNADSGPVNAFADFLREKFFPRAERCHLRELLAENPAGKRRWKDFISTLLYKVEFTYRDRFLREHPLRDPELPAIFIQGDDVPRIFISQKELNRVQSIDELIQLIKRKSYTKYC